MMAALKPKIICRGGPHFSNRCDRFHNVGLSSLPVRKSSSSSSAGKLTSALSQHAEIVAFVDRLPSQDVQVHGT